MAVNITNVGGGPLVFDAVINTNPFDASLKHLNQGLNGLGRNTVNEFNNIDSLIKKAATGLAAYTSLIGIEGFVSSIVRVRGEFQQLEVAFTTMLGSKEKANQLMAEVTEFAATTPFELSEVAAATKQLLAFGISAENIKSTLRSLGDVSAGIGAPIGEIAYLFGTIKTQGVALTQDVRQFAQRGIPIYEELAKVLKVNTEEVGNLITAGKVGFPEIQAVFQSLTAEGSKFGGLMAAQSKTLTGQLSNLSDAWNQMLNDIGKSNEGVFSDIIGTATSLVENYQDVIDILTVLVIGYGAYRAALIATVIQKRFAVAVEVQAALAMNGTSAAAIRQAAVLVTLQGAWRSLSIAIASFAPIAVVAALGTALYALSKTTDAAAESQENLNDVQAAGERAMGEEVNRIGDLLKIIKESNGEREKQIAAINKLREITGQHLKNYSDEEILAGKAKTAIDAYTQSIYNNAVAKQASARITELTDQLAELDVKGIKAMGTFEKLGEDLKMTFGFGDYSQTSWSDYMFGGKGNDALLGNKKESIKKQIDDLKKTYKQQLEELLIGPPAPDGSTSPGVRNEKYLQGEIERLKGLRAPLAVASKEYQNYSNQIKKLQDELNPTKNQKSIDRAINQRIEKLKELNKSIVDAESEAIKSGLVTEETAIDRINERYDELREKAKELKAGEGVLQRIENSRNQHVGNQKQRDAADDYKKIIDAQKAIFDQFETYKVTVGAAKAQELMQGQTKGFADYISFIESELKRLAKDNTLEGQLKFDFLTQELTAAQKAANDKQIEDKAKVYVDMLGLTRTFREEEKKIHSKYDALEKALNENKDAVDYNLKLAKLKAARNDELKVIRDSLITQSDLYQKLNDNILSFSRETMKKTIEELKEQLDSGVFVNANNETVAIPPEFKKQVEEYIKLLQKAYKESSDLAQSGKKFLEVAGYINVASNGLNELADALGGVNDELARTLKDIAQTADVLSSTLSSVGSFASGDIAGGVNGAVQALTGILKIFKETKQSKIDAAQQMADFQAGILRGELETNLAYRERLRLQASLNELKLKGLKEEKELLEQQKQANIDEYNKILAQLEKESFISGQHTEKKGGSPLLGLVGWVAGFGKKTNVVDEFGSLAGKSFDDLEKLFNSGQLTEKAKSLFEQLQKLKQEGVDIDKQLENLRKRQQELFTGTTSDGILDSIVNGFKNGLKSAQDFAGNFEDLMRNAVINALKYKYLEEPLKEFYAQFAAASQSDEQLTQAEIQQLQTLYNSIIENAQAQFDQLQQISGVQLSNASSGNNSLTGAIKGMTEEQVSLLAGQFGGLRMTALDQLNVMSAQLTVLNNINNNTAQTALRVEQLIAKLTTYETSSFLRVKVL